MCARVIVETGDIDMRGILVLREQGGLTGALMCSPVPGASAALWPPVVLTEEGREQERLQTKRIGSSDAGQTATPSIVHEVLRSPGQPLDPATRAFMEPRFGHDFSRVRVHSGVAAEQSARDVNAHAYTVGHNMVFAAGRFAPGTHSTRGKT